MTAILGLNAYHGDAAAALVVDGELLCAAEEERFNRVKHCAGFPGEAAAWCLADAGLAPSDLDHVAIGRDPRANLGHKVLRTLLHGTSTRFLKARLENAARVRDVKAELEQALGGEVRARLHNVEHHRAHVASAFFVSPFEDAAILSVDGFGDFASTMLAEGHGNRIEVLERVLFPHSLGIFYTAVTQWLGFLQYGDEGKTMGLAPYGTPRFLEQMRQIVRPHGDVFELGLDYFVHDKEGVDMSWDEQTPTIGRLFSARMEEAFGAAREPGSELHLAARGRRRLAPGDARGGLPPRRRRALGADEAPEHLPRRRRRAERGRQRAHPPRDALRGGVGAAGGRRLGDRRRCRVPRVEPGARAAARVRDGARVHGPGVLRRGPRGACSTRPASTARRLGDDELFSYVADRIAQGDVVGWFQGRMEFGPRALGHRSIVADPRRHDMKDVLNARIKHREPFRPFAPSVLAEAVGDWFEQDYPSPYMVLVYKTKADKRELVPAVNHVDDTGRVQTVTEAASPRYHRLIKEFERRTGVPILLNTSFNENEPIVMTPQQAVETFLKTRIDLLVLGNYVVGRLDGGSEEASEPASLGGQVEAQR